MKLVEAPKTQEIAPIAAAPQALPQKASKALEDVPNAKPVTETQATEKRARGAKATPKEKAAGRKADIYTERITLQLSPEMRDQVDSLARELQRTKTSKDERITSNSVMRVAIRHFLDQFQAPKVGAPNNEEELLAFVMGKSRQAPG
jgi:hypothetical protein